MRINKKILVSIMALMACAMPLQAKGEMKTIYMYGFAASFNDSTVYFTDVHRVDSAWIDSKTKFLMSRENYSAQLSSYLEKLGEKNMVCVASFAKNEKKARKKLQKMVARYSKAVKRKTKQKDSKLKVATEEKMPYIIKFIDNQDFTFQGVKPYEIEVEEQRKAEERAAKKD